MVTLSIPCQMRLVKINLVKINMEQEKGPWALTKLPFRPSEGKATGPFLSLVSSLMMNG